MWVIMPSTELITNPSPSTANCTEMLGYTKALINSLEILETKLLEASDSPDPALTVIKDMVAGMMEKANAVKRNINSINNGAINYNSTGLGNKLQV